MVYNEKKKRNSQSVPNTIRKWKCQVTQQRHHQNFDKTNSLPFWNPNSTLKKLFLHYAYIVWIFF